jgi:hypothetical protein
MTEHLDCFDGTQNSFQRHTLELNLLLQERHKKQKKNVRGRVRDDGPMDPIQTQVQARFKGFSLPQERLEESGLARSLSLK